jgi:betaine-aldehyde dehydrogenase
MRAAAATLKKISLELGGKSPNIFFADSDFDVAVEGALFGVFFNQGEVCSAGSRILVQRPIYKKFVDAMVEKAKSITVGLPMDRATKMGAIVSREQFDRVRQYQEIGAGSDSGFGRRPRRGGAPTGYFVQPTISTMWDNPPASHGKIFGPVASGFPSTPRRTRCGSPTTPSGLAAAVWTRTSSGHASSRACAPASSGDHMQPTYVEFSWAAKAERYRPRASNGASRNTQRQQVYINLSEQPIGWY